MEIKVLDNFLSDVYTNSLEQLLTGAVLPLYLGTETVEKYLFAKGKESQQFVHTFIQNFQSTSSFTSHIEPIMFNFMAKTEVLGERKIWKCKLNLNPRDISFGKDEYFPVHVDADVNGITGLYYINDADGNTLFFDNNYKVVESIAPKKGMMVYFDNQILHAGQPPKESPFRSVINFNWI